MNDAETLPPDASRARRILFAVILTDLIAFGIVLPLLPSYGARFVEGAALVGALVATDSLFTFALAPVWGRLSDRVGRRPILLLGLAGSATAYLLFGLATSFAMLVLSRMISGGIGANVNVAQAALADATPPARRSQAMGMVGAAFGIGFTVGPAIAGIASRFGDSAPGLVAAALAAANLLVALVLLPETRGFGTPVPALATRYIMPRLPVRSALVAFGTTLGFTVMYAVFPLYCQEVLGWSRAQVSYLFALLGLVTIVVQGRLVGRLAPVVGEARLARAGAVLLALGFVAMPLAALLPAGRIAAFALAVAAVAAGFSLTGPSIAAIVSRQAPPGGQGVALGGLQSVGAMARIVGPPLMGAVGQTTGLGVPFGVAAAAAALSGIAAGGLGRAGSARRGEDPVPADRRDP